MYTIRVAILGLLGAMAIVSTSIAEDYWIKIMPKVIEGFTVEAEIETNVPGAIILAARLTLKNQKPEDPFVGTGYIRVPVSNGKSKVTIDGCKTAVPRGYQLPSGEYNVEVVYNYLWPGNTTATRATGIAANFRSMAPVSLPKAGDEGASKLNASEGTRWVMENVFKGYPWDPNFWRNKFGALEKVEYQGSGDAKTLKMYYIKSINMTLLVDELDNKILAYRMGLAHQ